MHLMNILLTFQAAINYDASYQPGIFYMQTLTTIYYRSPYYIGNGLLKVNDTCLDVLAKMIKIKKNCTLWDVMI